MSPDETAWGLQALTAGERRLLLWLARESIRTALEGEALPKLNAPTPALEEMTGVFVSLHQGTRLRGCVGTVVAERSLHENVVHLARSAAFDDPRFPPLSLTELADITIEVSRLSRLVRAWPGDVRPGQHGVCIQHGTQRAVFLPQVATTYQWDRDTLLSQLCCKAQLPSDTWRRPDATLMVFVAEVFGEER